MKFILILLSAISFSASAQNFDFVKAANSAALGTFSGVANTMAYTAKSSTMIDFHTGIDIGSNVVNVGMVAYTFKGWKNKTKKQKRQTILNSVLYLGIGFGARQVAINYSRNLTFN